MGVLWAGMMFMGERERVSKIRTSPVCCSGEGVEGAWEGWNVGDAELGWGKTR
jgi:hypothetical protein